MTATDSMFLEPGQAFVRKLLTLPHQIYRVGNEYVIVLSATNSSLYFVLPSNYVLYDVMDFRYWAKLTRFLLEDKLCQAYLQTREIAESYVSEMQKRLTAIYVYQFAWGRTVCFPLPLFLHGNAVYKGILDVVRFPGTITLSDSQKAFVCLQTDQRAILALLAQKSDEGKAFELSPGFQITRLANQILVV